MIIHHGDASASKGRKDARRHRQKQLDVIKKHLPDIIADESIITRKGKKIVKIPARILQIPIFRPQRAGDGGGEEGTKGSGGGGIGQGKGKPGDVIERRPGQGKEPGSAGQNPGVDYLETEIEMEELIAMMLEDCGLPRLEEKRVKELAVELGWKVGGIVKYGPWMLLNPRMTAKQGIKRFWFFLQALVRETGKDELTCFKALKQADGDIEQALRAIRDDTVTATDSEIDPFPIFGSDDLRFREVKRSEEAQSNAVVIAEMDVSGSMDRTKKYLARSILFWLVSFLRKIYERVEIRFIIHTTVAKIVDEDSFFKTGESGGTQCSSAHELARSLVETEYPPSSWNVYVWHFSDGEDFDKERTCVEIEKLVAAGVTMFGYAEIRPVEDHHLSGMQPTTTLWKAIRDRFSLDEGIVKKGGGMKLITSARLPILGTMIERREHLLPALKEFLRKERWGGER